MVTKKSHAEGSLLDLMEVVCLTRLQTKTPLNFGLTLEFSVRPLSCSSNSSIMALLVHVRKSGISTRLLLLMVYIKSE